MEVENVETFRPRVRMLEMITPKIIDFLVPQRDEGAPLEEIMRLARDVAEHRQIGEVASQTARERVDVAIKMGALRDAIRASRDAMSWRDV
jgi:hypothetical protein